MGSRSKPTPYRLYGQMVDRGKGPKESHPRPARLLVLRGRRRRRRGGRPYSWLTKAARR